MLIRPEVPGDEQSIAEVHLEAFATSTGDRPVEAKLVEDLRAGDAWIAPLSLVATVDATIVGHVCCTRAAVLPRNDPVLGLGPIGVRPPFQRRGVGSALMHAVITAADALDEPLIVLLGHPDYYSRFGFRPAVDLGIAPEVPEWAPAFQARALTSYRPDLRGRFRYARPFEDV